MRIHRLARTGRTFRVAMFTGERLGEDRCTGFASSPISYEDAEAKISQNRDGGDLSK